MRTASLRRQRLPKIRLARLARVRPRPAAAASIRGRQRRFRSAAAAAHHGRVAEHPIVAAAAEHPRRGRGVAAAAPRTAGLRGRPSKGPRRDDARRHPDSLHAATEIVWRLSGAAAPPTAARRTRRRGGPAHRTVADRRRGRGGAVATPPPPCKPPNGASLPLGSSRGRRVGLLGQNTGAGSPVAAQAETAAGPT